MPGLLDNVTTADNYTPAVTVYWPETQQFMLQVANAAVDISLDKSKKGDGEWDPDMFVAPSIGLYPLPCSGIRIRSAVAGAPAQVTVQLFNADETLGGGSVAPFTGHIDAAGKVTQQGAGMITGRVNADATIAAGTGFTVAYGGTGIYVVTFTTPFAAAPVVVAQPLQNTTVIDLPAPPTASGFTARGYAIADPPTLADGPFAFLAQSVA